MDPLTLGMLGSTALQGLFGFSAANAQKSAAQDQLGLANKVYKQTKRAYRPFLNTGKNALATVGGVLGLNEMPEGVNFEMSPGAQFALEEGVNAIDASAANQGSLYSGSTLQALERLRFGMAQQDRENQLNRLMGLVGIGAGAAGGQAAASANYGNMGFNALGNYGNAASAAPIAMGNAISNGMDNVVGYHMFKNYLDRPQS